MSYYDRMFLYIFIDVLTSLYRNLLIWIHHFHSFVNCEFLSLFQEKFGSASIC